MPTYEFECNDCKEHFDEVRTISARNDPAPCPKCESVDTSKLISVVSLNFPGDGWASKNNRIAGQMRRKNERLSQRQSEKLRDGSGGVRLVPNVEGERTESWAEAKKLAKEKGKDTSGYDRMIQKEQRSAS